MSRTNTLAEFVRDALSQGRSRAEIGGALEEAGWSAKEIKKALAVFADVKFSPPVPRPRPHLTARDVFIYALMFAALGFTAIYLINLINSCLDIWLPDPADNSYYQQRATKNIRWAISMLVVFAPIYAWLSIKAEHLASKDTSRNRSIVRIWLTYITLFLAAMAFMGDGVYLVYHFISGETTLRFVLKAATVALVSGTILVYYLRDVGGMKDE